MSYIYGINIIYIYKIRLKYYALLCQYPIYQLLYSDSIIIIEKESKLVQTVKNHPLFTNSILSVN